MAANATIPERGIIAAVFVMVYSIFCLSCGFLLVAVLYLSREKFSYITLLAISTTCSTIVNLIQQSNYLAHWHELRVQRHEVSLAAYNNPALALGPLSRGFNEVLFWVVLYFYNVDSMLIMFWAMALVINIWNWNSLFKTWQRRISAASKVVAWLLPAVVIGVRKFYQFHLPFATCVVLLNILMLSSFAIGTICVILILVKYLKTRFGIGSRIEDPRANPAEQSAIGRVQTSSKLANLKMRIDPWLIARFGMAFLILTAFEAFLVIFEVRRYEGIQRTVMKMHHPDFSALATITDELNYLPGVTASLLVFLLFGTTRPLRSTYSTILGHLNPCKHWQRGSEQPSQTWDPAADDIELTGHSNEIVKGIYVDIEVTASNLSETDTMEHHYGPGGTGWYPGARLGILEDP